MFTPADWEDDVPGTAAEFQKVHNKKKTKTQNKTVKSGRVKKKKITANNESKQNNNVKLGKTKKQKLKQLIQESKELKTKSDKDKQKQHLKSKNQVKFKKILKNAEPTKKSDSNNCIEDEDIDKKLIMNNENKMYSDVKSPEIENILFKNKAKKKEKIKKMMENNFERRILKPKSETSLRERMLVRLRAARFRYLNEKLYLSESKDAKELFKKDPESFQVYHDGFRQQVKKWPINPLEVIIKNISKMPKTTKVADMGCGEAMLAKRVPQEVRSFDLVAAAEGVEECDMARTPLSKAEMDVAVYCLALMGTNLKDYFVEANRILKTGGIMKIAEVESRFQNVKNFIKTVESYGFSLSNFDDSRKVFYFFDFRKERDLGNKTNKLPVITLDPCLYKKR